MNAERLTTLLGGNDISGSVLCLERVSSTNEVAKNFATQGKECLITAEEQTAGKGRFDRTFESQRGGLYMSACLKVNQNTLNKISGDADEKSQAVFQLGERLLQYPVQAGIAVGNALKTLYGESFEIKQPNDILLNGKKVCGILMEAVPHDDDIFLIFGVGVNLKNELSEELQTADNLKNLTGKTVEREILCTEIIRELCKIL